MASRQSKNEDIKKVIAGVKGESFTPKAPRKKGARNEQAPRKEPVRWGKPYVPQASKTYITGEGNPDAVPISRNHNGNTRTVGDVTPTKFFKGKHEASAKPPRESPKAKFTWKERNEMKAAAAIAVREDRLAAKKARRHVRPAVGITVKPEYIPHAEYQRKLAAQAA